MAICTGITYSAGDDRITIDFVSGDVHGDSFDSPYTLQDIYDTDQSNGWGVFQKYGNVYISDASIWIEGADTYFQDGDFVLSFQGSFSDSYLLKIIDANVKQEIFGLIEATVPGHVWLDSNNIDLKYVAFFDWGYLYLFGGNYNCISLYNSSSIFITGGISLQNVMSYNNDRGFWAQGSPALMKNTYAYNCTFGIYIGSANVQVSGLKINNSTKDFQWVQKGYTTDIIDSLVDINSNSITTSQDNYTILNLKSTFKVNISGGDTGTATLYDQFGSQVAQQTLSGEWELADPVLYAKRYVETDGSSVVENTKTLYEPFKLVVTKTGYQTLTIPNITVTAGEETNVFGQMKSNYPSNKNAVTYTEVQIAGIIRTEAYITNAIRTEVQIVDNIKVN